MLPFTLYYVNIQKMFWESFQDGKTPLNTSCLKDFVTVVSLLLKEGANVNIKDEVSKISHHDH